MFRTNLAKEEVFPNISIAEDTVYLTKIFVKCRKIVITENSYYHYIRHKQSALVSGFSESKFDQLKGCQLITEIVKSVYPELMPYVYGFQYLSYIGTLARIYVWDKDNEYKEYTIVIKENIRKVYRKMNRDGISKAKLFSWPLYLFNNELFRKVMKRYYRANLYKNYIG